MECNVNYRFNKILNIYKMANKKENVKSWEDFNKYLDDYSNEIRNLWSIYVKNFNTINIRNETFNSFVSFTKKKDLDILPDEAYREEVRLLPEVAQKISYLLDKKKKKEKAAEISKREDVYKPENANKYLDSASGVFGSLSPKWIRDGYNMGPAHHTERKGRTLKGWKSNNAWDLLGESGTIVYSITDGVVKSVSYSNNGNNIFGNHITISGTGGYPDVFYTHVESPNVKPGDIVRVGTKIARITTPPNKSIPSHVHIGIDGLPISSLIESNGRFKS